MGCCKSGRDYKPVKDVEFDAEKTADTLMDLSPKDAAIKWVRLQHGFNGDVRMRKVTQVLSKRGDIEELLSKLELASKQAINQNDPPDEEFVETKE